MLPQRCFCLCLLYYVCVILSIIKLFTYRSGTFFSLNLPLWMLEFHLNFKYFLGICHKVNCLFPYTFLHCYRHCRHTIRLSVRELANCVLQLKKGWQEWTRAFSLWNIWGDNIMENCSRKYIFSEASLLTTGKGEVWQRKHEGRICTSAFGLLSQVSHVTWTCWPVLFINSVKDKVHRISKAKSFLAVLKSEITIYI